LLKNNRDIQNFEEESKITSTHERYITGDPNPTDVEAAMKRALSILSTEQKEDPAVVKSAQQNALNAIPRKEPLNPFDIIDTIYEIKSKQM